MQHLGLMVEGVGDVAAVPLLVRRLLAEYGASDALVVSGEPLRVKGPHKLVKRAEAGASHSDWIRQLGIFGKRKPRCGAVLLVLDGDLTDSIQLGAVRHSEFDAGACTKYLLEEARQQGAGTLYSLGICFLRAEFETLFLAGMESLAGRPLPDGTCIKPDAVAPTGDLEGMRAAKAWLQKQMIKGTYAETVHQAELTRLLDLNLVRQRKLSSFQQLEQILHSMVDAARQGRHIIVPDV